MSRCLPLALVAAAVPLAPLRVPESTLETIYHTADQVLVDIGDAPPKPDARLGYKRVHMLWAMQEWMDRLMKNRPAEQRVTSEGS